MTRLDKEAIRKAYDEVRDDKSETTWIVLKYEGNLIAQSSSGNNFNDFRNCFKDDERAFGYLRMNTGDELSVRAKFAFLTWCGKDVNAIKRAKLSIDKAIVKEVINVNTLEAISMSMNIEYISKIINSKEILRIALANTLIQHILQLTVTLPTSFAIEILASDQDEISESHIKELLVKAGGANYGTGSSFRNRPYCAIT